MNIGYLLDNHTLLDHHGGEKEICAELRLGVLHHQGPGIDCMWCFYQEGYAENVRFCLGNVLNGHDLPERGRIHCAGHHDCKLGGIRWMLDGEIDWDVTETEC